MDIRRDRRVPRVVVAERRLRIFDDGQVGPEVVGWVGERIRAAGEREPHRGIGLERAQQIAGECLDGGGPVPARYAEGTLEDCIDAQGEVVAIERNRREMLRAQRPREFGSGDLTEGKPTREELEK